MPHLDSFASHTLAQFCVNLRLQDVPDDVVAMAKTCIADTVAVATYGSAMPWSRTVSDYAQRYGAGGPCRLLGAGNVRVHAPYAALANGAFAHAFEQDSVRKPGAGVHPGATLLPPALALAQELNVSGARLLLAFIAGCEVMFRIGDASLHSSEGRGFHAPGLTGPYGAAVAAGMVLGLDAQQLQDALGIAGSLSGGLLAFSQAKRGAEVKRLHLGRACESGVLAARLALAGYAGPETILEGRFGFLEAYCQRSEAQRLTAGLGSRWETRRICIKAYACHITAHTAIESLRTLMQEHAFDGNDVETIALQVSDKVLSHHDIRAPGNIMQAQYSVPFCVALALHRDPADPGAFDDSAVTDARILHSCRRMVLRPWATEPTHAETRSSWCSQLRVTLKNGETFCRESDSFAGSPERPLSSAALNAKFSRLTAALEPATAASWLQHINDLDAQPDMAWLT